MNCTLILKKLNRLKMPGIAASLQQRLEEAIKEKWSYSTLVEMLLTDEIEKRSNKQLTLRLAKSRLTVSKTLETFNFEFNPKIPVTIIRELASCEFIEKKQNIFLLGHTGVGKSHIAQGICLEACRRENDVLFYNTQELFEWIYAGRGDGSHKKRLAYVIKCPLLLLDDFGLQPLNEVQQNDLYQLIADRYEKRSTIITSNRDVNEWVDIFSNPLLGSAAVDRLVHRAVKIDIEGPSYRNEEFKKTCVKAKKRAN